MTNKTIYSLELIAQRKAEKEAQLKKLKEQIIYTTEKIVEPPQGKNNAELWIHYAGKGMVTYQGILTAIKLYRRIRGTFSRRKEKKGGLFSWL